ncbi:phage recombination protein Bet [Avibacterium paragallinarum]|nr:phage recombination protein Bet [Avibacterium paragallinarum]WAM60554.1 phage recombination protein Bet [Avibacterium paragallinarum]
MGSSENLPQTLMATAFRGQNVSPDQMTALLVVANQHGLNPWTNEIYAFPNNGGIVPIVGVDGWSRIMNDHPQFDGIEFTFNDDNSCTCNIYRKDRTRPTTVTEYMNECSRNTQPWKSHPKRMLRHKAMIQCARLAFGFTGIYDQDEAERIVENQKEPLNVTPKPNVIEGQAVELATSEQIDTLNQLIQLTNTDTEKAFAYYSVQSIEQLSKAKAEHFIKTLNGRLDESAQNADNKTSEEIPL